VELGLGDASLASLAWPGVLSLAHGLAYQAFSMRRTNGPVGTNDDR